jgi:3-methyladenine DNA glycosylase AlkD
MDMLLRASGEIRNLADPEKAKVLAGFFKTGKGQYAEGDIFLGITVPETRKLAKKYSGMQILDVQKLLSSKIHEERLLGLMILIEKFQKGDERTQEKIYKIYLKNTRFINSWDLVDLSAHEIVGAYLQDKQKNMLLKLAGSKMLWEKRIAMVATFHEIRNGRSETTLKIAEKLLRDEHDLIQKAVGWMLREVGKRCSQREEEVFLKKYARVMPRTTLRYAIERFDDKKKKYYMKLK